MYPWMTVHIDIRVQELFCLSPNSIGEEEKAVVAVHIQECPLCHQSYSSLERMYKQAEIDLQTSPSDKDRLAASRILPRKVRQLQSTQISLTDGFGEILTPPRRSLARRAIEFVMHHPVRTGAGGAIALASFLVTSMLIRLPGDANPSFARVKDEQLTVFNSKGETVWNRPMPGFPDGTNDLPFPESEGTRVLIRIADVDGDGVNEVLLSGSVGVMHYPSDSLYCLEASGELRWSAGVGQLQPPFVDQKRPASTPNIMSFLAFRRTEVEKPRIFMIGAHGYISWAKVIEVERSTGKAIQAFHNRGHLSNLAHIDLDRDGLEELVLGGVNDGFNRGCVILFDPDSVSGVSPIPEAHPTALRGSQKEYILFPVTRLQRAMGRALYSYVRDIIISSEEPRLTLRVLEPSVAFSGTLEVSLFYPLGSDLRAEYVIPDDAYMTLYGRLMREGKIESTTMSEYLQSLRDSVLYWNGKDFQRSPHQEPSSLRDPFSPPS